MAKILYIDNMNGIGEDPIELHKCRRFVVYGGGDDSRQVSIYYQSLPDNPESRWIEYTLIQGFDDTSNYREVHAIEATHTLLTNNMLIPQTLERFREYKDKAKFLQWIKAQYEQDPPAPRARPHWNVGARTLSAGGMTFTYSKKARNQFPILTAFEKAGWPRSVAFDEITDIDDIRLNQAVKDFNKKNKPRGFFLTIESGRVAWHFDPIPEEHP